MIVGLMGVVFQVWLLHVRAEAVKNSTLSVGVSPCKRLVLIRIMKSTTQFPNYVKHFLIELPVVLLMYQITFTDNVILHVPEGLGSFKNG